MFLLTNGFIHWVKNFRKLLTVLTVFNYFPKVNIRKEDRLCLSKDLLNRLYSKGKEILKLVDKITLGAEKTILNIPRKDRIHKGSADTLYNHIIIEFENNLIIL